MMSEFIVCLFSCFCVILSYFSGFLTAKKNAYIKGWKAGYDAAADFFKDLQEGSHD